MAAASRSSSHSVVSSPTAPAAGTETGAVGLDTTLWLLDREAAAKLPPGTAVQG
ncbi:hypothetical protein MAHJHV28_45520 [Mycobacterium avium subsp. hominissuis]